MRTSMVKSALDKADRSRAAGDQVIVHSDRGVQYASTLVREFLASKNAIQSMSRKGNCWDNSMMETFFGRFKVEHMFWEDYQTRAEARSKIFEWIEIEYNRKRAHSAIGYVSPAKSKEDKMAKAA
jgi:transposase InsO family protein